MKRQWSYPNVSPVESRLHHDSAVPTHGPEEKHVDQYQQHRMGSGASRFLVGQVDLDDQRLEVGEEDHEAPLWCD